MGCVRELRISQSYSWGSCVGEGNNRVGWAFSKLHKQLMGAGRRGSAPDRCCKTYSMSGTYILTDAQHNMLQHLKLQLGVLARKTTGSAGPWASFAGNGGMLSVERGSPPSWCCTTHIAAQTAQVSTEC